MESWEAEMFGWGGSDASIDAASFVFATEDGRVSGSKSAFKTRASFADKFGVGTETAMAGDVGNLAVKGNVLIEALR